MKYIVIVPDGMADNPIEELGNKTPLEVANTTNMDFLARNGRIGNVQTIPDGMSPGSDIGNMALLGYDPRKCHTGRSPLEAASMDIQLKDNEIAFRCNLVTILDNKMIDYSAGHIKTKEATLLIEHLDTAVNLDEVHFYPGKSYRHLLILKVRDPQTFIQIKTIPPHDILEKNIAEYLPSGKESEMLLKLMETSKIEFANHAINKVRVDLDENPANMIWLWGQGTRPNLQKFDEKHGIKGAIISAVDLVNGIGKVAGLEIIDVPGITGYYDTNYLGKAEYALKTLKKNDFVYIHVESPDEAGHNGDYKAKINAIEQIDKHVIGTVLNHFDQFDDVRILISPDHPTPVKLRTHTSDPVGFIQFGKNIERDEHETYSEAICNISTLKYESGEKLLNDFIHKHR